MSRILIIDDDDHIRLIAQKHLELCGYEVDTAINGRTGLELTELNHYDLVVTDIFMPDQDGLGVIIELNRQQPLTKIIVMTGGGARFDTTQLLNMAKMLKADSGLAKPFEFDQLITTVKSVLAEASEQEC